MVLNEHIKNEIVRRITEKCNVDNIILFGSYANGNPNKYSDIDLLIILNQQGFLKSFREKIQKKGIISSALLDLMKKYPIDLLVYTKDEWKKLLAINSQFHKDINNSGIKLI